MKKIFLIIYILTVAISSRGQTTLDDFGRVILNAYLPETLVLPNEAKSLLLNKLNQITTNNGMGGSSINPRFVLVANVSVLNKGVIPGPPQMVSLKKEITFYIVDAYEEVAYANTSLIVSGVGTNENRAYINGINQINPNHQNIVALIDNGKNRIIAYYQTNCHFIIREAMQLSNQGEFDAAMLKLSVIPAVSEKCYIASLDSMIHVFQRKIDTECMIVLSQAKSIWMSGQNTENAKNVASLIRDINPFSSCQPELDHFINEIQGKFMEDERREWEFHMQQYNDGLLLKQEALRIEEEDRKRRAALDRERQMQQYDIVKADQEAGGFRGFISALNQLKVTMWRSSAEDYINQNVHKVDYSKVKF